MSSVPVPSVRPYLDAIAGGYHSDPFSVLGPHETESGWEVRAFLPQAASAELIFDGAKAVAMEKIHPTGFWIAPFDKKPPTYCFRLQVGADTRIEYDPYSFPPILTPFQLHLHGEGTHYEGYSTLGAHLAECEAVSGVRFAVWAPNALIVSVVGDFNGWDTRRHPMRRRDAGIWELFLPDLGDGTVYKFYVRSQFLGYEQMKADPYAFASEHPPRTGSVVTRLDRYEWNDAEWLARRAATDWVHQPLSVYEIHPGSWMHAEGGRTLTYRELAAKLVPYVRELGFTHIELLPILEHPYTPSWGYQVTGYFAPTSRYGSPDDFKFFVDACHAAGIGVILDWVPAHFPRDVHGLDFFDGTALYEHQDPRQGEHRDWGTKIFNFGRNEVRSFLISSAIFWLKEYHLDGLRVDAVASMLYLDYSRQDGEWVPNEYGGRENLAAIEFLKRFNEQVHLVPGAISIAEESTSFPAVSRPVYMGGLGFTFKWNMGWMHDMLSYFEKDSVFRKYHQNSLTFSLMYAFTENFLLPISHDEVVHGKGSLVSKMSGDEWQRFANARAFLAYMWAHPGKKLLFMGCEIGTWREWNHDAALDWDLLQYPFQSGLQHLVRDLNRLYLEQPALWEVDDAYQGFEWVDFHDVENSILAFLRWSKGRRDFILFVCNFTPVPRGSYRIGVPRAGLYDEILNTDAEGFGGSNLGNAGQVEALASASHGHPASLSLTLPPLSVVAFRRRQPALKSEPLDAIVIGGGHNGLVTAAYLARAGRSVLVLERREMVGGCSVTEELWPGYRVSTGAYLSSLLQQRIVDGLELERFGYHVEPKDPPFFSPFPDGRHLFTWQEAERTHAEIAKFSARDASRLAAYEEHIERLAAVAESLLLETPPVFPPTSLFDLPDYLKLAGRLRGLPAQDIYALVRIFTQSAADFLDDWFESPEVKVTLATDGVIGANGGPRSPGTAYVLLHHCMGGVGGRRGVWGFVRGGMGGAPEAMAASARSRGAQIRTNAAVERVLVENGRAVGVVLAGSGEEIRARIVVSNLDPKLTFLKLTEQRDLPDEFLAQVQRFRCEGTSCKINLALNGLPDFLCLPGTPGPQHRATMHLCPDIDYVERAWDDAKYGRPSERPLLEMTVPTMYDPSLAPPGKHVMGIFLQYAPYTLKGPHTWDELREPFADRVLNLIAEYAPNIHSLVEHRQVLTPLDLERRFGITGGNIFHGEMSLDQMFVMRPAPGWARYRTPIEGLYLCGSGTHPGGGVMGAPGYNAAREILKDAR